MGDLGVHGLWLPRLRLWFSDGPKSFQQPDAKHANDRPTMKDQSTVGYPAHANQTGAPSDSHCLRTARPDKPSARDTLESRKDMCIIDICVCVW